MHRYLKSGMVTGAIGLVAASLLLPSWLRSGPDPYKLDSEPAILPPSECAVIVDVGYGDTVYEKFLQEYGIVVPTFDHVYKLYNGAWVKINGAHRPGTVCLSEDGLNK
mgnify:CR=1 FL=1